MGITQKPWVNFIGFQFYWWSCILLQNHAVVICLTLLIIHLYFHQTPQQEAKSLLMLGVMGFTVDCILALFDWFQFNHSPSYLPPVWLLFLWLGFATNVTTLSSLFKSNWLIITVAGGLLAPLSYLAAAKLGAVIFPSGMFTTWLVLVPIWTLLLPALFYSQYRLEDTALEN